MDPLGLEGKEIYPTLWESFIQSAGEFYEGMVVLHWDFWKWLVLWDYYEENSFSAVVGKVVWGEIPFVSIGADGRDLTAAIGQCENWIFCWDVWLNAVGFIPVVWALKNLKHVDEIETVVKSSDNISKILKQTDNVVNPDEVKKTINRINANAPQYQQDGSVFNNVEWLLPIKNLGYYRERTVTTPWVSNRWSQRIIQWWQWELFYTSDHYKSFTQLK